VREKPQGALSGPSQTRTELARRLRARKAEIEDAIVTRVRAIPDPDDAQDPAYTEGQRAAVAAAVEYGLAAVERGERDELLPVLLTQARLAARSGVSLDTVMRRYLAGHTLFADFVIEVAAECGPSAGAALRDVLRFQATVFERLLALVTEEHGREPSGRLTSAEARRAAHVEQLLAGEPSGEAELGYDLDAHHLAVVAGAGADAALRELATALDRRLLTVRRREGVLWAWLGGRRDIRRADLTRTVERVWPGGVPIALGEPGRGPTAWRLSHRQAKAAWTVAERSGEGIALYTSVALLASMLRDELLCTSLHRIYLAPLKEERDGGEVALETLRAYFTAGRNVSSAAAALGVTRQTVGNRLRAVEDTLEQSLLQCAAEVEAALRLEGHLRD